MSAPVPLHIVAVCHRLAPAEFITRVQSLLLRCGRSARGVVVANHPAHALESPLSEVVVIRGSNDHLDFSGYFEGLTHLTASRPSVVGANVLFVNDSLLHKHAAGTLLSHLLRLDGLIERIVVAAIAGKLDPYRSICLRNPWSHHTGYMTTFCFLLNPTATPLLARLPADAAAAGVLEHVAPDDPAWATGIDPALREQIRAHVAYPGSPYRWVGGAATGSVELVRKKARCVYFEHRLSGAIGERGALVPINAGPRSRMTIGMAEVFARLARFTRGSGR